MGWYYWFGVGYLTGCITYSDNFNRSFEENKFRKNNQGMLFGVIGAITTEL